MRAKDLFVTSYWERNFPMPLSVRRSVGRFVSVFHNFLKGRAVTMPCSYRSNYSLYFLFPCFSLFVRLSVRLGGEMSSRPSHTWWYDYISIHLSIFLSSFLSIHLSVGVADWVYEEEVLSDTRNIVSINSNRKCVDYHNLQYSYYYKGFLPLYLYLFIYFVLINP